MPHWVWRRLYRALAPVEEFDREHIRVLTDKLSTQAEEVQNLNARLEALIEIGHELNVAQDPSELVERYCRAAREVIGAMCASACITDESGRAAPPFLLRRSESPLSPEKSLPDLRVARAGG